MNRTASTTPRGGGSSIVTPKLTQVIRLDSLPLGQTSFTPEGYLKDRPILTSTGIFEYTNPDGSVRRELRLPEDVFDPESLSSYKGKPIIITHDAGMVTKDNVQKFQIGTILSEGYRSGDDVRAEIVIHDTDAMKDCGLKELSLGYSLDLDETPGEWHGQRYDAIQRNIRINHLALVREARAGDQARLNIDGRDSEKILKGGKVMKKTPKNARRADGVLSPEELQKAIEEYKARRAAKQATVTDDDDVAMKEHKTEMEPAVPSADSESVVSAPTQEDKTIEEQVAAIKGNKDRRDNEGDPEDVEAAKTLIADQDDDIQALFDIIDTLLAQREFDEGEPTQKPAEEPAQEPAVKAADGDGECIEQDSDDDDIPSATPSDEPLMNADSVDAIVRQRIQLGMVGRSLNLDGLENMSIGKAKMAVIAAVRPNMRLDGKSAAFINAAYEMAASEVAARGISSVPTQKRQMFNKESHRMDSKNAGDSSASARQRMMDRHMNKKEDK